MNTKLAQDALQPLHDLFNGGPDTSCRTTWIDNPLLPGCSAASIECVEVPIADLREAFDRADRIARAGGDPA